MWSLNNQIWILLLQAPKIHSKFTGLSQSTARLVNSYSVKLVFFSASYIVQQKYKNIWKEGFLSWKIFKHQRPSSAENQLVNSMCSVRSHMFQVLCHDNKELDQSELQLQRIPLKKFLGYQDSHGTTRGSRIHTPS